ncbi:MAG: FHA domain-containing protein [Anaerolineae bacterium]|nr:FHA domain-containing protein [Anaerolineae bacterium]
MVTKPLNQPRQPLEEDPEVGQAVVPPPAQDTQPSPPPEAITAERSGPAWRILLHVSGPQASTVGLDIWRVTVMGRADPMSAFQPDLDLAPYGAMRHGVSRRHALVRPAESSLYLIDQNSTNGTWVNGQRLAPGRDFPLTDGDTIELGALRMNMRIVHTPEDEKNRERRPESLPNNKRKRFGWPR